MHERGDFLKLEVKDIRKSFGKKEVLHGVSFQVETGRAMGFLGRNGAGKSTTIRALMGIFHQDSGEFLIDGKKFVPKDHSIGFLPEERGMYSDSTIMEQLIYFGTLRGASKKNTRKSAEDLLDRVGLLAHKGDKLSTLSKGNQQKVQIVQSLLNDPDIVILDEPFSGLDPINSQILKDIISDIVKKDKLVIFSSHQMNYVEEFCKDITLIDQGNIVISENLPALKKRLGEGKYILRSENYTLDELKNYIDENLQGLITEKNEKGIIIKDERNEDSKEVIKAILNTPIEIESFSTYEPSLHDIFIKYVGDEK